MPFCHPHLTDQETEARPGVPLVKIPELVSVEAELGRPRPHAGFLEPGGQRGELWPPAFHSREAQGSDAEGPSPGGTAEIPPHGYCPF